MKLYEPLLARGLRFLIRLRGDRHLVVRGRARRADDLVALPPKRRVLTP